MLNFKRVIVSAPRKPEQVELQPLVTPWSEQASLGEACEPYHPHPQFEREQFQSLNGWWDYRIVLTDDAEAAWRTALIPTEWDGSILVPFSPEAPLSTVNRQLKPNELLWYKRSFACPDECCVTGEGLHAGLHIEQVRPLSRCILHFEAVDYACACYCNGVFVGSHVGAYLPFSFDVTESLCSGENEIAVCVYDPSDEGVQLRGKQRLGRGGIWYTAQSGIWQTVWLEAVPENHIESLGIDAQPDVGRLTLTIAVRNSAAADEQPPLLPRQPQMPISVKLFDGDRVICTATVDTDKRAAVDATQGATPSLEGDTDLRDTERSTSVYTLVLDVASPHLWSPEDPHLYSLELTYGYDKVKSYCAFRTVTVEEDNRGIARLCLNHEPYFLRGVLDQGYWPDGLMTAPSDEALVFDIQTMKSLGFNMLRKHIKIESDRWYYHCDRLGMLVWQDMVSGGSPPKSWHTSYKPTFFRWSWRHYDDGPHHYHSLSAQSEVFRFEWADTCRGTINYLANHPSIFSWSLFNEGWGQFETQKATEMVRNLDPMRPIDAVSGWYDQACGDFLSVHNYYRPLKVYKDSARPMRAFVLSEFGGFSYHLPDHSSLITSYGYESYTNIDSFGAAVQEAITHACALEQDGLIGFVYTQLSDIEEETNGLLTYDRRINKLDALCGTMAGRLFPVST